MDVFAGVEHVSLIIKLQGIVMLFCAISFPVTRLFNKYKAFRAISSVGTFSVVRAGVTCSATSISSKPVMLTSPGTSKLFFFSSVIAPSAISSLAQISAVGNVPLSKKYLIPDMPDS